MTSINKKKNALLEKYNQEKLRHLAMKRGVTLRAPETVFLSKDTKFGKNVIIHPYVVIGGKVKIANNVEILPFTHIEDAKIESNVSVGPYARIRPGAYLESGVKVGNFVEVKKSKVGKNSKINPDNIGPIATPNDVIAVNVPIAFPFSFLGNTENKMALPTPISIEIPMPIIILPNINIENICEK